MPSEPVRVVVDAFGLTDGSELRGMGGVLRHLLQGLALDPRLNISALCRPSADLPPRVRAVTLTRHDLRPRLAQIEHDVRLPRDLRRVAADVVWSPGTFPPRFTRAPLVQTLHDVTPLVVPNGYTGHEARRWKRSAARVRKARRVVAVSRSSADQAVRLLGVDPALVEVVHNGVDDRFSPSAADERGEPYLLYVGAWGPHKGYAEALAVVSALTDLGYPHRLKIAGPHDAWMRARINEHVAASGHPERVDVLGWVPELVDLYRGAAALVFTSRAEGFGLPLVEAMACGLPVVAFDNTSVPEVVGDAGILVADGDVAAFVAAVRSVVDSRALADELRIAGPERANTFTWSAAIERYRDVFAEVAGSA